MKNSIISPLKFEIEKTEDQKNMFDILFDDNELLNSMKAHLDEIDDDYDKNSNCNCDCTGDCYST